ncbi:MAG: prenyltransferase [Bacteroidaceae bacterium]|nr:prenyltransferase [Bacteroidaceae bacterium]
MPVLITLFWLWSRGEEVNWLLGVLAILNIVLVHAAGNVWSDISDYRSGVDAQDTYGIRLLVDGDFTVGEFRRLSVTLNILAVLLGILMVALTGLTLLYIGVAGILLSLSYPRLKYMALGDVVIILCYALLPMLGTSYIATGRLVWDALWLAVPVGLITVAILHANNVRDIETDQRAGIRTFPMLTGRAFGVRLYAFEVLFPYLWLVALVLTDVGTGWLLTGLLALPVAVANVRMIWGRHKQAAAYSTLDEKTAQLQLLFSLLLIVGMTLSVYL